MKYERIIVTGVAGFIGYHTAKSLLDDGYQVLGIDNINDYYSISLKQSRLKLLTESDQFSFAQIDLSNRHELTQTFNSYNPHKVIHLAAQAGVRYSLTNPYAYVDSNIVSFVNILELCRHSDVEGLVYASSSSVYGGNEKMPFSVDDRVDQPLSLYAATKRANELMAHSYSHLYGLHTTGLRFFTAYGPWGRPDMAMYIFAEKISTDQPIQLFNHGNMKRDFTYIDDIVSGIRTSLDKNYEREIFNLGNHRSESIIDVVHLIEEYLGKKAIVEYLPIQPGDVPASFADIDHSRDLLNFKPETDLGTGLRNFINWYKVYTRKK